MPVNHIALQGVQRRCTGCCVPFSGPRCFLPVTVYGTTHAYLVHVLATVVGPSPNGPQQFKVYYSRTQKFFTVHLDPNNICVT